MFHRQAVCYVRYFKSGHDIGLKYGIYDFDSGICIHHIHYSLILYSKVKLGIINTSSLQLLATLTNV